MPEITSQGRKNSPDKDEDDAEPQLSLSIADVVDIRPRGNTSGPCCGVTHADSQILLLDQRCSKPTYQGQDKRSQAGQEGDKPFGDPIDPCEWPPFGHASVKEIELHPSDADFSIEAELVDPNAKASKKDERCAN